MMSSSLPPDSPVSDLDFTDKAFDTFFDAVDDPYFLKEDLNVIYKTLKDKMENVSFGDYLKRYIYQKAEMSGAYQEIPVSVYRDIICDSFRERQTPASFTPT